jgi:hypothetical protein
VSGGRRPRAGACGHEITAVKRPFAACGKLTIHVLRFITASAVAQLVVGVHVRYVGALLVAASVMVAAEATAKCAYRSTREHFLKAETVVLVSIVEAHDGPVPWPFGIQEKGSLPGRLLKLRVLRSWKGVFHSDDVVDGWTLSPRGEDAYPRTDVGTQIIVYFAKRSPHEIMSCNAADPDRLDDVSSELDTIVRGNKVQQRP